MAAYHKRTIQEEHDQFDDAIWRPDPEHRMALPKDDLEDFSEDQRFDQIWIWALLGVQLLIIMVLLVATSQTWWSMMIIFLAMVLTMVLIGSLKLTTWIDDEGVHFKMNLFHRRVRTIPWEEIDQIHVREYSPLKEYGGWGIRYGNKGWAYNVKGKHGLQILKTDGKRILIGTQNPEEVSEYLASKPLLV